MIGPFLSGEHASLPPPDEFSWEHGRINRHRTYTVVTSFSDADGDLHIPGEQWMFLGSMFSKFDDLLTICIKQSNGTEWRIPLVWGTAKQGRVIEYFVPDYVRELIDEV